MPEIIPDHVPSPRTLLAWDGTAYRPVSIDAAGRLQVRGEDQLFSFRDLVAERTPANPSGADGYVESGAVPANRWWVITNICAYDATTPLTEIRLMHWHDGAGVDISREVRAFAIRDSHDWQGHVFLDGGDTIRATYIGSLAGDICYLSVSGYEMTVEV